MLSRLRMRLVCADPPCSQRLSVAWVRRQQGRHLLRGRNDVPSVDMMRNPVSHERNLIGGFLLMAGGVALLAYAHKLKQRLVGSDPALIADELDLPAWVIEAWQRWIRRGCLAQRNFCRAIRLQSRV